jgi:hypothetical protein
MANYLVDMKAEKKGQSMDQRWGVPWVDRMVEQSAAPKDNYSVDRLVYRKVGSKEMNLVSQSAEYSAASSVDQSVWDWARHLEFLSVVVLVDMTDGKWVDRKGQNWVNLKELWLVSNLVESWVGYLVCN